MDIELQLLLKITTGEYEYTPAGQVDTKRLIRLALRHKVAYPMLLYAQKHPSIFTAEQIERLNQRNRKVARQSLDQLGEMKKIAEMFIEKGIGYICIKGPQLSRMLYGKEARKDSVDLDIILTRAEDLQIVHKLLTDSGYTQSNLNEYPAGWRRKVFQIAKREVHYYNPVSEISIDLHIRPGANTYLTEGRFTPFLKNLQQFDLEGTSIKLPELNHYFVYLCYHASLHQFIRLAWLLDIRTFLELFSGEMDFEKVINLARDIRIERSVLLALYLLKENFGDEFFNRATEYPARIQSLAGQCMKGWVSRPGYSLSLKGRWDKLVYIMKLLSGFQAKIDWLYGIFTRQLIKFIRHS